MPERAFAGRRHACSLQSRPRRARTLYLSSATCPLQSVICLCPPVRPVTGRSHSACDSIRFLVNDAGRNPLPFAPPGAGPDLDMDEGYCRPGHASLQFGLLGAPHGAAGLFCACPANPAQSAVILSETKRSRRTCGSVLPALSSGPSLHSQGETHENLPGK
jgi:hypothetical protein